jgi:hypothetical protein
VGVDVTASNARRLFSSAFRATNKLYQIEQIRSGYGDAREFLIKRGLADWERPRPTRDDLFTHRKTVFAVITYIVCTVTSWQLLQLHSFQTFFALLRIMERAEKSGIVYSAMALICKLVNKNHLYSILPSQISC